MVFSEVGVREGSLSEGAVMQKGLGISALASESRDLVFLPSSVTGLLGDLRQITSPLCGLCPPANLFFTLSI